LKETVFVKTPAGQQEITARQLRLHPRLRSLLVLIDGRHRASELLQTLSAIGVTEASLEELEKLGLISAATVAAAPASEPIIEDTGPQTEFVPRPDHPLDETERKRELYAYFNEAIRNHLGLRGFMLQLQVEKAESLADYHAIRDQFITALGKSKGGDFAKRQGVHIDALLGAG
jgi:hypothetical protein